MTTVIKLDSVSITIIALVFTCAYGLRIDFSSLVHRPSLLTQKRAMCEGNPCEPSKPFLCRSSAKCIALKFVCDGSTWDCDDGFDEDPAVCNAASRPSVDDLYYFVENEKTWMIPKLFNGADMQLVAHALSVASDMNDLREQIGMTDQNVELLRRAFESAVEGDERPLLEMGMPGRSWHEVQYMFQKLMDSGFKY